jgi:hypothetical protein
LKIDKCRKEKDVGLESFLFCLYRPKEYAFVCKEEKSKGSWLFAFLTLKRKERRKGAQGLKV